MTSSTEASTSKLPTSDENTDDFGLVVRPTVFNSVKSLDFSLFDKLSLESDEESTIDNMDLSQTNPCTCDPVTREYFELKNLRFTHLRAFTSSRWIIFRRLRAC